MPGNHRLESKSDFQGFCTGLRASSPSLDDLVEVLRALERSTLRPADKGRLAQTIARHMGERFHPAEVRAVASVAWPPEIAAALGRRAPALPELGEGAEASRAAPRSEPDREHELDELRALAHARGSPLTIVLMGDEGEHRRSRARLEGPGIVCVHERSPSAVAERLAREVVVGLVVGASWWSGVEPSPRAARSRLRAVLALSSLCWTKLVRAPAWAAVEGELPELCSSLYFTDPPRSRLAVEDHATITRAELRSLTQAAQDLGSGEQRFDYEVQPTLAQDRMIRAVASRYLRDKHRVLHAQGASVHVRALGRRSEHGLACVVAVVGTDLSFVVKVSRYDDAWQEARRFVRFAHGTAFELEFYGHAPYGALVVAPIGTRLGRARSLESILAACAPSASEPEPMGAWPRLVDSVIAALERFSRQVKPEGVTILCAVDYDGIGPVLERLGPLVVAGVAVDLRGLLEHGLRVLDSRSRSAVVHGDAHAGNVLLSEADVAILIDYECAGLGPACYDLCTLWVFAIATHFVAVGDEQATVGLLRDLLAGREPEALAAAWPEAVRLPIDRALVLLASRAMAASVAVMPRAEVLGIVALVLCRELLNPELQQLTLRCALRATQDVLRSMPT